VVEEFAGTEGMEITMRRCVYQVVNRGWDNGLRTPCGWRYTGRSFEVMSIKTGSDGSMK